MKLLTGLLLASTKVWAGTGVAWGPRRRETSAPRPVVNMCRLVLARLPHCQSLAGLLDMPALLRGVGLPLRQGPALLRRVGLPLRQGPALLRRVGLPLRQGSALLRRVGLPLRQGPALLRGVGLPLRQGSALLRRVGLPLRQGSRIHYRDCSMIFHLS